MTRHSLDSKNIESVHLWQTQKRQQISVAHATKSFFFCKSLIFSRKKKIELSSSTRYPLDPLLSSKISIFNFSALYTGLKLFPNCLFSESDFFLHRSYADLPAQYLFIAFGLLISFLFTQYRHINIYTLPPPPTPFRDFVSLEGCSAGIISSA